MAKGQSGKRNSRSNVREEIREIENIKALFIELNSQRIKIKRAAFDTGSKEAFRAAEKQRIALIRLKRIFSRYYTDLNVQLEEEE